MIFTPLAAMEPSPICPASGPVSRKGSHDMTYEVGSHEYIENGPEAMALRARSARSTARVWRALDHDHRLAAVETALQAANDIGIDDYPIAL
jgi:hypothetical protein